MQYLFRYGLMSVLTVLATMVALPAMAANVPFTTHPVDASIEDPSRMAAGDLDGDGDQDFVSLGETDNSVSWYENDGSTPASFTKNPISTTAFAPKDVFVVDVGSDGDLDILVAQGSNLLWHENDGAADPTFTVMNLASVGLGPISVAAGDLDGDGDVDVVSADIPDVIGDSLVWHENDGAADPTFSSTSLDNTVGTIRSISIVDLDGDGDLDILTADSGEEKVRWYENDGLAEPSFTRNDIVNTRSGPTQAMPADLDKDGDLDVVVAFRGGNALVWYESDGAADPTFTERTIQASVEVLSVSVADFDCDGDLDIAAADVSAATADWYESDGASPPTFTKRSLDTGLNAPWYELAHDMDGDGDADILFAARNGNEIKYYENRLIHRDIDWTTETIVATTPNTGPVLPTTTDLDSDGDLDFIVGELTSNLVTWYDNDGSASFTRRTVGSVTGPLYPQPVDLDLDGDLDIIVSETGTGSFVWFESDGGSSPIFTKRTIGTNIAGIYQTSFGDLDGDGDIDLVACTTSAGEVRWFESNGGSPPSFTQQLVGTDVADAESALILDVNRDGHLDILASGLAGTLGQLGWYENDGAADPTFSFTSIGDGTYGVYAADMDNDGDIDVLPTYLNVETGWYENMGGNSSPAFTFRSLTAFNSVITRPVDVDKDGDLDIVPSSGVNPVRWLENDGLHPAGFTLQEEEITSTGAQFGIGPGDFDSDGDLDAVIALRDVHQISYLENTGTQFTVAVTDVSPGGLGEDTTAKALFQIDVTHHGRAGDKDGRFNGYKLLFEETVADPLTGMELEAMADTLSLWRDNGAGPLDVTNNDPVHVLAPFLTVGVFDLSDTGSNMTLDVDPGSTQSFYFALDPAATAASATPNQFIATWLGADLALTYATDDGSFGTIAASANTLGDTATNTIIFGTAPTADTISPSTASPTSADTVNFDVTFSETVVGFDSENDLVVSVIGDVAFTGAVFSGSGNAYTVGITGVTGDGLISLAVSTMSNVTDGDGIPLESSVASAGIIVDNTAPVITLNGAAPLFLECNTDTYNEPGASALDDVDGGVTVVVDSSAVDESMLGDYLVTYEATDSAGNTGQVSRTVTVQDTLAPVITRTGLGSILLECGVDIYTELGATVSDFCDDTVSVVIGGDTVDVSTLGVYTVTYDATDTSSNVATQVTRTITVGDSTPPVITLNGDAAVTIECGIDTYTELGATVTDACDSSVSVVIGGNTVDESTPGTYIVSYTATDASLNSTNVGRIVTVEDTTAPNLTLTGDNPLELTQGDTFTEPGFSADDVCDGDVTVNVIVTGSVDTSTIGSYELTYTVSDANSNQAQVVRAVNVNTKPTDINEDGTLNAVDIQTAINIVLGIFTGTADVNNDGMTNSIDIQLIINAVLGTS